jgi:hypothetical protein
MAKAAMPWRDRVIVEPNGCWLWPGAAIRGYGVIRRDGKNQRLNRVAWEETNGPIPDGLCVCHVCDNPSCCNPGHLFLGTVTDNNRDMIAKGRSKSASGLNARKTHCPQGHAYDAANTRIEADGARKCRQCDLDRHQAKYYRLKAERAV